MNRPVSVAIYGHPTSPTSKFKLTVYSETMIAHKKERRNLYADDDDDDELTFDSFLANLVIGILKFILDVLV